MPRWLGDLTDEPSMLARAHEIATATDHQRLAGIVRGGTARGELRAKLDVALATEFLHAAPILCFLTSGGRFRTLAATRLTPLIDILRAGLARHG